MHELILTSQSPRRRQLLEELGYEFRIFPIEVSEILDKNLNLTEQISRCAQQKVEAAILADKSLESEGFLCLAADTVVVLGEEVLGKPKNEQQAYDILTRLSGQVHSVITGFCLFDSTTKRFILGHDQTQVTFKKLSDIQIKDYVKSGDSMDKAGAYGIQGEAFAFVESVKGSINNVIGLPTETLEAVIKEQGWVLAKKS